MAKSAIGSTGDLIYSDAFHHMVGQGEFGSSAVPYLGAFVAPCDLTLKSFQLRSTDTLTADATIDVGTSADPNGIIDGYAVNGAAQLIEGDLDDDAVISLTVQKGDFVYLTLNADADANAGDQLAFTFVWVPTATEG